MKITKLPPPKLPPPGVVLLELTQDEVRHLRNMAIKQFETMCVGTDAWTFTTALITKLAEILL